MQTKHSKFTIYTQNLLLQLYKGENSSPKKRANLVIMKFVLTLILFEIFLHSKI